jgi:REP element-mobilizing transposase RayT
MSRNYKFHNPSAPYFVSFATVFWIDVFTREAYFTVLANSITYCRKHKGMEVYAYCFMPNHVHLVFSSAEETPMGLLRDFKKYTAGKLLQAIREHPQESRRTWMLDLFQKAGRQNNHTTRYQFWQHNNKPIELWSVKVIKQKINYVHKNPVASGFVTDPVDWKYSSARNFQGDHNVMEIDEMGFMG